MPLAPLEFWCVMVTDFGSPRDPQRVAPRDKGEPHPHSERFWSWIRVGGLLLLVVGLGYWGYTLRPTPEKPISVSEPQIAILADKPDVTAMIDMALASNLGQATPYTLTLTITPVNPVQGVTFKVSFDDFPTAASGSGPLQGPASAPYATFSSTPGSSGTALLGQPFTYRSAQPIGENSEGAQLRVAFPDLMGEKPGAPVQNCAASSLGAFSTICGQLGNASKWVPPLLDAGTTTFSSADPALGDYQYVAGDNPTLLYNGGQWTWSGINGVQMLAASVQAQANEQNDVFYSGVLLGVAASAGIAFFTELLRPAWRKEPESPAK